MIILSCFDFEVKLEDFEEFETLTVHVHSLSNLKIKKLIPFGAIFCKNNLESCAASRMLKSYCRRSFEQQK